MRGWKQGVMFLAGQESRDILIFFISIVFFWKLCDINGDPFFRPAILKIFLRYAADPCLRLCTVKNKKLKPVADLKAASSKGSLVRDSAQLRGFAGYITGAEERVYQNFRFFICLSNLIFSWK